MTDMAIEGPDFRRHLIRVAERRFGMRIPMNILEQATVSTRMDYAARGLIVQMAMFFTENVRDEKCEVVAVDVVEVPEGWADALKLRFAPPWFLRRWPARMRRIETTVVQHRFYTVRNICPHVDIPQNRPEHLEFMLMTGISNERRDS